MNIDLEITPKQRDFINAEEFVEKIINLKEQLYSCVQLVLREHTGNYKLDEILEFLDFLLFLSVLFSHLLLQEL